MGPAQAAQAAAQARADGGGGAARAARAEAHSGQDGAGVAGPVTRRSCGDQPLRFLNEMGRGAAFRLKLGLEVDLVG